ncbi:MAG: hypothetical protein COA62_16285 [Rhodobiaceae bacterium]|nr:MAG: hypothetical protein COA62_16285 [Rhodobiaceae bacterium]
MILAFRFVLSDIRAAAACALSGGNDWGQTIICRVQPHEYVVEGNLGSALGSVKEHSRLCEIS